MTDAAVRIYVVEDEALIAMEISDRLAGSGYVVCGTAARGETALAQFLAARPDLVLMDIHLAGALDGIETAAKMQEILDIPVVFLTAYSDGALISRAVETAPAAYLLKPFQTRELHATIQTAFYQHRLKQALRAANEGLETQVRARTAELVASEARLKAAQRIARIGDWVVDLASGAIDWSDTLYEVFGRDPGAYRPTLDSYHAEIVHPDDRGVVQTELEAALITGTQRSLDHRILLPDGGERWVHLEGMAERNHAGAPVRLRGVAQDITERKLSEFSLRDLNATLEWRVDQRTQALAASERFVQGILDAIGAHLAVLDASGRIVATNTAWRRFAGESGQAWQAVDDGTDYLDVCDRASGEGEQEARQMAQGIRDVLGGTRASFALEYRLDTPGRPRWFLARIVPFASDGPPMAVVTHDDVTIVHDARERVAEGERVFASLALASPVGVFRTDAAGQCEYVNRQFCEMTGLNAADALADGWTRPLHPEDRSRVAKAWAVAVRSGLAFRDEYRFVWPDGRVAWVLGQAVTIPGPDGGVTGMIGTLTDITERKQVELAMRALSEELVSLEGDAYFEAALRRITALLDVEIGFVTRFDPVNPDELRMAVLVEDGLRQPSLNCALAGTPCADVRPGRGSVVPQGVSRRYPDDERLRAWSAEAYAGEALLDHAGRVLGTVAVVGRCPFANPIKVGTILRLFAVALSAEVVRERDRRRYEDLFEFAPSGLVLSDRNGRIVMVNRLAEELFGWSRAELQGQLIEVLVPPGSREGHERLRGEFLSKADRRAMASGRRLLMALRKDGSRFPVEIELAPVETEAGQMVASAVRDVSQRIEAEVALEEARRHLVDTIESTAQAMILFDVHGRVAVFNRQFLLMYPGMEDVIREGTPFETIVRTAVARGVVTVPVGVEEETFIVDRLSLHQRANGTPFVRQVPDGRTVSFSDRRSRDGGIVTVGTDITELLEQQQRIREMQKMDAIGKLTGGMAHDFNNYLGVIIGNLDLLQDVTSGDPEAEELVEEARQGAVRAADLTRSLLAFARRQPLDSRVTDLRTPLASLGVLLSRSLGEDVELQLDVSADLWPVKIDVAQFESSVINLANNARDAMPSGGELRIAAQNMHIDASKADSMMDVVSGDYVCIEVSDTGAGMTPEVKARVFEPFFTTKGVGHGTGLGLSMVYGFVTQSGGVVRVYSETGQGTVIRMYVPRADQPGAGAISVTAETTRPPRGHETILVVEDNEAIRHTVLAQLVSLGYRVLEAESGPVALRKLEEHQGEVALVFSDVVMPGYPNGHELADVLEERFPKVRVLLTSGFPGDAWSRTGAGYRRRTLLGKPYRKDELARTVRRVLDATDPSSADAAL